MTVGTGDIVFPTQNWIEIEQFAQTDFGWGYGILFNRFHRRKRLLQSSHARLAFAPGLIRLIYSIKKSDPGNGRAGRLSKPSQRPCQHRSYGDDYNERGSA